MTIPRDLAGTARHGTGTDRTDVPPSMDWRFLLPDPNLGRVGVRLPMEAARLGRIATCADEVVDLRRDAGWCDVVVLIAPSNAELKATLAHIEIRTAIRVEDVPRRRRRRQARLLRDAGFEATVWWARPSTADTRCLVSLDHGPAAATILRTVARRARWSAIEAGFAQRGLARRWAGGISLLAVAPLAGGVPAGQAVAAPHDRAKLAALVTPRFARSKAVVGVTTIASGRALRQVVKVPRARGDEAQIRAEAAILDEFHAHSAGACRVPDDHHLAARADRIVLVEDAASGHPLDRRAVRRNPDKALEAGLRWLRAVPVGPTARLDTDGRAARLIDGPLALLRAMDTRDTTNWQAHVDRAAELLAPLRHAELPVVFEHGDFSHPNLFVAEDGELVAIDWERGEPRGLPLHDATFFAAYLAESVDRPKSEAELVAAHHRAVGTGGWARPELDLYAEQLGLDRRVLPLLELACWTRSLAGLASTPAPTNRPGPHRYEQLWVAAIHDAEGRRR